MRSRWICIVMVGLISALWGSKMQGHAQDISGLGPKQKKRASLKECLLLPSTMEVVIKGTIKSCAEAVASASLKGAKGQRLLTTGTLTQSTEKFTEWTYSAEPADRLRVVDENKNVTDFFVGKVEGEFKDGLFGFFSNPHKFRFRVEGAAGKLRVDCLRGRSGSWSASRVTVSGTVTHHGKTYSLDLKVEGKHFSETIAQAHPGKPEDGPSSSTFSAESRDNLTLEGTITTKGFSAKILELHNLTAMTFGGARGGQVQRHSTISRTFDNRWTQDGMPYRYKGRTFKTFGERGEITKASLQWACSGVLLRDGKQYGVLRMKIEPWKPVEIFLDLPDQSLQLEYIERY